MSHAPATAGARRPPERSCIGCRRVAPKRELIRLVLAAEPSPRAVVLDATGRAPGRGAYLCRQTAGACLAQARKRRALPRAFRTTPEHVAADALAATLAATLAAPSGGRDAQEVMSSPL